MMKKESFADILKNMDRKQEKKISEKLPSLCGISVPTSLAFEQCSSEAAARHKAAVALDFAACVSGTDSPKILRIADLTGGLGIDSWAFSRVSGQVLYNEMNRSLAAVAKANFESLGIHNIIISKNEISAGSSLWINDLQEFKPDLIYLDPARRDAAGKKVFLLEDCSPNVLELLPELFRLCGRIMVKLSPMADISMVCGRLKGCLRAIHVVGIGECKELLCLLEKGYEGRCRVQVDELNADGSVAAFSFFAGDRPRTDIADEGATAAGRMLLVPLPSVLKAGCHDLLCSEAGISKLDRFTHIYSAAPGETARLGSAEGLFKVYEIIETVPFNSRSIKDLGSRYPGSDVSARNLPLSSARLESELFPRKPAAGPSGPVSETHHIFGYSTPYGRFLSVCVRR